MTPEREFEVECQKVSAQPGRPDGEREHVAPAVDVTERAERRADDALSDFGSAAIGRRWRRDED